MAEEFLLRALVLTLSISAIPLGVVMLIGFSVALFQAVTQLNEQTLSFVPKLFGLSFCFFLLGPWISNTFQEYFAMVFDEIRLMAW